MSNSGFTDSKVSRRQVAIVGGGPSGLAAALMLAKRGWTEITVLENRPAADYYEPDKSFSYQIDGRGQKLTDFLGLTDQLSKISVPSTEFYLTVIKPDGSRKTSKLPIADPNRKTAYWLPRRAFVSLLDQEIQRSWQNHITVLFNTQCVQINKIANEREEEKLEVVAKKEDGSTIQFECSFLLGCDGINSVVRQTLLEWDKSSDRFKMKQFPSPSAGLKYKVLTLLPQFPLDKSGKEFAVCSMAYAIRSTFSDRKHAVSLGILPFKDPNEPRTANIITWPDSQIWQLKNSDRLYDFLEKAFPQLPIREIVSPTEAERFAKSEGGYFPIPQYCSGFYSVGTVLVGDAIHCFPPDLGQGVNSALEDICVLDRALEECNDDLKRALPLYESKRFPDVKALIRLVQIGYPWQYNQDPLRKKLWSINFFFRLVLNRLFPYLFSPPAFILIQNHQLSYHEILAMVQRTTQTIYAVGLLLIGSLLAWVLLFFDRGGANA